MIQQTTTIEKSKGLCMTPEEKLERTRTKVRAKGITALAALTSEVDKAEEVRSLLGLEEVIACDSIEKLLLATKPSEGEKRVAGVLEVEGPNRDMTAHTLEGQEVRAIDLVRSVEQQSRLGMVHISAIGGVSCMSVIDGIPNTVNI